MPKKPYNPILGEVFRCYWDIPNGTRSPPNIYEKVSPPDFMTDIYVNSCLRHLGFLILKDFF